MALRNSITSNRTLIGPALDQQLSPNAALIRNVWKVLLKALRDKGGPITSLRMLDRYGRVRDTEIRRAVTGNAEHVEQARKTGATNVATATQTAASQSDT
jgi:hypothetical protein